MNTLMHHIERVKEQPHHVRKQVALLAAGVVTAIVGLIWLVGSVSLGSFAIKGSNFAESTGAEVEATSPSSGSTNLAGAAAALKQTEAAARIEIVDTTASTSQPKKAEQTIIPF